MKATVLDALHSGYEVMVVKNLTRGVHPGTSRRALTEKTAEAVARLESALRRREEAKPPEERPPEAPERGVEEAKP